MIIMYLFFFFCVIQSVIAFICYDKTKSYRKHQSIGFGMIFVLKKMYKETENLIYKYLYIGFFVSMICTILSFLILCFFIFI
jgi:hypothetical protein